MYFKIEIQIRSLWKLRMLQTIVCMKKLAPAELSESRFLSFPNKYASFKTFPKKIDKYVQILDRGASFFHPC